MVGNNLVGFVVTVKTSMVLLFHLNILKFTLFFIYKISWFLVYLVNIGTSLRFFLLIGSNNTSLFYSD